MRLYHGSNVEIHEIDLRMCRPYKDFGKGFYLTDIRNQADRMASRTVRMFKGSPHVSGFEFGLDDAMAAGLKILVFSEPNEEWASFVMRNRDINVPQPCHDYDIVIGPVADDTISRLLRLYTEKLITEEQLLKELSFSKVTSQYCFLTAESIEFLSKVNI